ncbi:hypothetical protein V8E36_004845 [Tilletia maclaganii]
MVAKCVAWIIFYDNPRYIKLEKKEEGGIVPPESRLQGAQIGGVLLVVGLAWFAAADAPSVQFMVPIIASAPFGAGMVLVFFSVTNYLVDSYLLYASSVGKRTMDPASLLLQACTSYSRSSY